MNLEKYRNDYMPCQSNFDPYPGESWDWEIERDRLAEEVELVLARMQEYWTLLIAVKHQHEPEGFQRQWKLWSLMSDAHQKAFWQMMGLEDNDDSTLPKKTPSVKDVRALANTIAETLIENEVYSI